AAVVLVELEGRPRKAVAEALGVPEGTLSSRLAKARKLLADRLRRRGFALPVGLVAAVAVPPGLAAAAVRVASLDAVPPCVAALAAGVTRMMFATKLTAATLGMAVAVLGMVVVLAGSAGGRPVQAPPPASAAP